MSNYVADTEVIPTRNNEGEVNFATGRKRSSKRFDDLEQTPFTGSQKNKLKTPALGNKYETNCFKNSQNYFCEFCNNTSIHGFKFLGERQRYFLERVWWMFVISGALYFSATLIQRSYHKWVTSPIVVTFATSETALYEIPFPAITICPEVNAHPKLFNYTDVYLKYLHKLNTTANEDLYFKLFSNICNEDLEFIDQNATKFLDDDEYSTFTGSFADLQAEYCKWLGNEEDCDQLFDYILTSEGWCRTFNMLDQNEVYVNAGEYSDNSSRKANRWSLEHGYPLNAGLDTYPKRTMLAGIKAGLQLDLFVDDDNLDYLCGELQGFKVTLHHPAEVPNMDTHFRIPLDQAVVVAIKPAMITTSDEIRDYSPEDRLCYLPGEKQLSSYKIYTQQNCMVECLTNYTLDVCGCAGFYMISEIEDTKVCGAGSKKCLEDARVSFLEKDIKAVLSDTERSTSTSCSCLPACTSINFDSEVSQTEWNWRKTFQYREHDEKFNYTYDRDHFSRLIVYYKNLQFMTSERHELYGLTDFLANCGGLFGLFCGLSFTSVMEILYYLTLRIVCNVIMFGRRIWSGDPEMVKKDTERKMQMELK